MDRRKEEDQAKALGLIVLSALCLSYSGFQTYQGYSTDLGFTNSLVLSIILTSAMFVLSMTLRIDIKRGHSQNKIALVLSLYLIAALFSFLGNFNSFYKALMQDTVVREEIQEKLLIIQKVRSQVDDTVRDPQVEKMKANVNSLIEQFKSQLKNQLEPGLGNKSEALLVEIENNLGQKLTRLKGNSNSDASLDVMAEQYEVMVKRAIEKSPLIAARGGFDRDQVRLDLNKKLDIVISDLNKSAQEMTNSSNSSREIAKSAIQAAVSIYKEAGTQLKRYDKNITIDENIRLKNTNLGMISHTMSSAFSNLGNVQTWVAIILALLIELFVPALVFALTPRGTTGYDDSGHSGIEHI
jgi:hypothetical protein